MTIRVEDLDGLDFSDSATRRTGIGPVRPGDVFLKPLGLSGRALADDIVVPTNRITEIIAGRRTITAETAIMLGRRFGTTAEFWLGLQMGRTTSRSRSRSADSRRCRTTSCC